MGSVSHAVSDELLNSTTTTNAGDTVIYTQKEKAKDTEEKMGPYYGMHSIPFGVTTFAELQAARDANEAAEEVSDLAGDLQGLLGMKINIVMNDDGIDNKKQAILDSLKELAGELSGLVQDEAQLETREADSDDKAVWTTAFVNNLPDSSFLYVEPGGKKDGEGKTVPRSKRHFPYKDASGKVDLPHLRNAIGRAPQANVPPDVKKRVQARARRILGQQSKGLAALIAGAVKSWFGGGEAEPELERDKSHLMFWKDKDGVYNWITTYSNNFRDDDNPPEIISAKSHQRFDGMLTDGSVPMPDLHLWHVPQWEWGKATWHAYDDAGFPVAGGTVNKGCEWLAEKLDSLPPDKVAVSHGMPKASIKYDPDDPTVIIEHITREISPLPAWAAANKLTGFKILAKEANMAIPQEKRDALVEEWGLEPAQLDALEAANAHRAEEGKEAGIETKETDTTPAEEQPEQVAEEEAAQPQPLTREEVAGAVVALRDQIVALQDQVAAMSKEIVDLRRSDEQKVADKAAETPAASLVDLVKMRAVGSDEAKVDGRTKLGKNAGPQLPEELKEAAVPLTPIPWINQMLTPQQQAGG